MVERPVFESLRFALERAGFDVRAGLSLPPGLGPVADTNYRKAWRLALEQGLVARDVLTMAQHFLVGSLAPYDVTLFSAATVGEALHALTWLWPTIGGPGESVRVAPAGAALAVEWHGARPTLIDQLDALFSVGAVVERLRQHATRSWRPSLVRLSLDAKLSQAPAFEAFFQCPVVFGARAELVLVPKHATALKLRTANRLMSTTLRHLVERATTLPEQVQRAVAQHARRGAPIEDVAATLGRHPRQLQRSLEATGKRYRELRDAVLWAEARWLLVETDLAVVDIAGAVGFSDAATFTRAFSRWQGSGPAAYRAAFRST